jgi:hypothetical protein
LSFWLTTLPLSLLPLSPDILYGNNGFLMLL